MKVALTGGTGYIGSHVLTELREHNHEVTAMAATVSDGRLTDRRRQRGRARLGVLAISGV